MDRLKKSKCILTEISKFYILFIFTPFKNRKSRFLRLEIESFNNRKIWINKDNAL